MPMKKNNQNDLYYPGWLERGFLLMIQIGGLVKVICGRGGYFVYKINMKSRQILDDKSGKKVHVCLVLKWQFFVFLFFFLMFFGMVSFKLPIMF